MRLSIVIPVYNVEKYIRGTLQSVYGQRCDESLFEVIVVNDGTPDGSMCVAEEFAARHANLHIVNQENRGLSCARNAGLETARGEYVWFVDSDDMVTEGSIKKVVECGEETKADVIGFCICKVREAGGEQEMEPAIWNRGRRNLENRVTSRRQVVFCLHTGVVQRYVFRREFLSRNGLCFLPGILYEDMEFVPRVFCLADSFYISSFVSYRYLLRSSGSIMSQPCSLRSLRDILAIVRSHEAFLREEGIGGDAVSEAYVNRCVFLNAYRLLAFSPAVFPDGWEAFMREHRAEIRRKCLRAGWVSLKGDFRLTKAVRLMMVLLLPRRLMR